jgi:UDP:flavonoid glycosyltransferase YjiC (YdhE family)
MRPKHIAFCLEAAYGHIIPTLGTALELIRRGHRVSYAVPPSFGDAVHRAGAKAMVFTPLNTRSTICTRALKADGRLRLWSDEPEWANLWCELRRERTADSLSKLECVYNEDRPDAIAHDDNLDIAGRSFALKFEIPRIRVLPTFAGYENNLEVFSDDQFILVVIPRFFFRTLDGFDRRFKFIGYTPEGARSFFSSWPSRNTDLPIIQVCPTTGLMPQLEFCRLVISAFSDEPWHIVLSIGNDLDSASRIDPSRFANLPANFEVNRLSSNLDILEHASLFVGQGGQRSTLDAIYSGVPSLLVPPSDAHDAIARRTAELGFGRRLSISEASPENLRKFSTLLLNDRATRAKIAQARHVMAEEGGAEQAADAIEQYLSGSA